MDIIVLQSRWKSFVSVHDLKKIDFLVFKYDGMYRMKVLVFDPSGCEKVPPCFVTKNAISGGRKREEPIDISSNYANLPMRTPETKKKALKQRDRSRIIITLSRSLSNSSGWVIMSSNLVASMYIYKIMTSLFCLVIGGMTSSEGNEAHSVSSYMLPRGTSLDSMKRRNWKRDSYLFVLKSPSMCVVKKSNISERSQAMVS